MGSGARGDGDLGRLRRAEVRDRSLVRPRDEVRGGRGAAPFPCWGNGPTHIVNGPHVIAQELIYKYCIHQGVGGKLPPPPFLYI